MRLNYPTVVVLVVLWTMTTTLYAQSDGPEFLSCSNAPVSLCVQDEGVRLPATNQVFTGDLNPDASRCSVHLRRSVQVETMCGNALEYEVRWYSHDTSEAIILQPSTTTISDSSGRAVLFFDSENATDQVTRSHGLPYNSGCLDLHRLEWIVRDSCGQEEKCVEFLRLYDCRPPQIQPKTVRTILVFDYSFMVSVAAKDFVISVNDDCTRQGEILYSFSNERYIPDSMIYCDEVPVLGFPIPLPIWVADRGIDSNCDGVIAWEERQKWLTTAPVIYTEVTSGLHCGIYQEEDGFLSGEILTSNVSPVTMVNITLTSPGHVFPTYMTGENGRFTINNILLPNNVTITPKRNDHHKNGVSTLDGVKILKHLLGKEEITDPYGLIAADLNNSHSISAIDLIELRKLILGLYDELPHQESWRFVPKDFVFEDTLYPWPYEESLTFINANVIPDADFIGVKIGDVNHTAQTNLTSVENRQSRPSVKLNTPPQDYVQGSVIEIPLFLSGVSECLGLQMTLHGEGLEFISASSTFFPEGDDHFALFNDVMTLSWFNLEARQIPMDQPLLTIRARVHKGGNLQNSFSISSSITEAELYTSDEKIFTPVLQVDTDQKPGIWVFPMIPNPLTESGRLEFYLEKEANIKCMIFDAVGRKILEYNQNCPSGYNRFNFSGEDFHHDGLFSFRLEKRDTAISGKFIVSQ